jgi:hypothetical protein
LNRGNIYLSNETKTKILESLLAEICSKSQENR